MQNNLLHNGEIPKKRRLKQHQSKKTQKNKAKNNNSSKCTTKKKYPVEDDYKDDDDGLKGKILQIKNNNLANMNENATKRVILFKL